MIISKEDLINDILFYDITEFIKTKQIIYEENNKKQRILAKIAHEFKTPINSIIGLISVLKENLYENKISSLNTINLIENLSKYIIFLISDIIHYVNPNDIEDLKVEFDKVNLFDVLNFCFEILKSLISCNQKKFENINPELIIDQKINKSEFIIITDEIRLKQILLNFISNSVKFTNHGKIQIICKLVNNGENIMIGILDTGVGIKENNLNKLFSEFTKLDDINRMNKLGDGLGLSICKYLAKKLNIIINYESQFGKGTKFDLLIPYKRDGVCLSSCRLNSKNNLELPDSNNLKSCKQNEDFDENKKEKKSLFKLNEDIKNFSQTVITDKNKILKDLFLENINFNKNTEKEGFEDKIISIIKKKRNSCNNSLKIDLNDSSIQSDKFSILSYNVNQIFNSSKKEKVKLISL